MLYWYVVFCLVRRRPPRSTRSATLFPSRTLVRSRRPDSQFFRMRYLWRLCSLQTRRSAERVTDGRNQPRNERSSDKGGRKPIFDRPTAISPVWFVVHPVDRKSTRLNSSH